MNHQAKISVLFICMGNICRSPTAQGLFEKLLEQHDLADRVTVDSAGTHAYHVGKPPDKRAQAASRSRKIKISKQRARQVSELDFPHSDIIVAMDRDNLKRLLAICPREYRERLHLMSDFGRDDAPIDVPDPYYGGESGFKRVVELLEQACKGLIIYLQAEHLKA